MIIAISMLKITVLLVLKKRAPVYPLGQTKTLALTLPFRSLTTASPASWQDRTFRRRTTTCINVSVRRASSDLQIPLSATRDPLATLKIRLVLILQASCGQLRRSCGRIFLRHGAPRKGTSTASPSSRMRS